MLTPEALLLILAAVLLGVCCEVVNDWRLAPARQRRLRRERCQRRIRREMRQRRIRRRRPSAA